MAIGFKEWSHVCALLGSGAQSLILRKGGIAEGREGFQFRHPAFFLFPTRFHEQEKHLTPEFLKRIPDRGTPSPATGTGGEIAVSLYAEVVRTRVLDDWDAVSALSPFHAWSEQTVRERFDYEDAPGISVAVLRVHRLPEIWVFPDSPRFGGCRSWLELPECPAGLFAAKVPVLDDGEFQAAIEALPLAEPVAADSRPQAESGRESRTTEN